MSLINDALKHTQQTMQGRQPPRLDELELRPIEPAETPPRNDGGGAKRIIWVLVLFVVTCNIALWIVFKDRGNETEVAARSADTEVVEPIAQDAQEPAPVPDKPAVATSEAVIEAGSLNSTAVADEVGVLTLDPPVVERPEFRLNTIVTHPVRPSAMINNRILFMGDRVEGYTVTAIGQHDVTLVLDGDEVVVSLP